MKTDDVGFALGGVTTRVGIDGSWIGATGKQSYLFSSIDPGEHHICTNWQSSVGSRSKLGSALTFTAEAGKIYYFRVSVNANTDGGHSYAKTERDHFYDMKLEPIDPAEAQFLISSMGHSTSQIKK